MEFKKMRKQSINSAVLTMILIIGVFFGMFIWFNQNVQDASLTVDSKYNETYTRLQTVQDDIDTNVNSIKTNLDDIKEADNSFQVAWNGLKGLGNTLKLPVTFISNAYELAAALIIPADFLPQWAKNLMFLAIISFFVLLILAKLSGESVLQ